MNRLPLLATLVFLIALIGCNPNGSSTGARDTGPKSREETVSGVWRGEHKENPEKPGEGATSNFLAERLGGYSIRLLADGQFIADWRGLTKEGTWKLEGDVVFLKVDRVLGKTREQADTENKQLKKEVTDLSLFDKDSKLQLSSDNQTLTLKAEGKDAQTVIFEHEPE